MHSVVIKRRRQWHPTPVLLPGKSHGRGSLEGYSPLRVRRDWATSLSLFTFIHWRRKWQPTLVFLPWESQGQGTLSMGSHRVGHDWSDLAAAAVITGKFRLMPVLMDWDLEDYAKFHICAFRNLNYLRSARKYWVKIPDTNWVTQGQWG